MVGVTDNVRGDSMTEPATEGTASEGRRLSRILRDLALALALAMAVLWKETRDDWGGYSVGERAQFAGIAVVCALIGLWIYDHFIGRDEDGV